MGLEFPCFPRSLTGLETVRRLLQSLLLISRLIPGVERRPILAGLFPGAGRPHPFTRPIRGAAKDLGLLLIGFTLLGSLSASLFTGFDGLQIRGATGLPSRFPTTLNVSRCSDTGGAGAPGLTGGFGTALRVAGWQGYRTLLIGREGCRQHRPGQRRCRTDTRLLLVAADDRRQHRPGQCRCHTGSAGTARLTGRLRTGLGIRRKGGDVILIGRTFTAAVIKSWARSTRIAWLTGRFRTRLGVRRYRWWWRWCLTGQ